MEESDKDDYDVLGQLAKGGQGTTSRVRRKRDNSIWVLKESYVDSTKAGNSALREAKTLQSLNHPNINRYQDVFLHQEGGQLVVCTVMEYCEGGDLAHYLIAFKRHNMIVDPDRVLKWMQQMCSAIAYMHAHKVVHRDMKPQNIFMMNEDSLRVGDFGLAQTIERGKRTSQVGTPCYMAPEVLQHDAYAESVDVWGLGCIGLEAVTLEFLWERKGMLAAHVVTNPIEASNMSPEYPASLRECIARCLIHAHAKRPSAALLEGALHRYGGAPLLPAQLCFSQVLCLLPVATHGVPVQTDRRSLLRPAPLSPGPRSSAVSQGSDSSGLAEVFGNLATQWTSWLTPPKNSLAFIAEEQQQAPEQAVLSQMPDTVPHRPEGRPIPLTEQRELARLAAMAGGNPAGPTGAERGLHAIQEAHGSADDVSNILGSVERAGREGQQRRRASGAEARGAQQRSPAQLEAEVSRLLAAAQASGRAASGDGGRGGGAGMRGSSGLGGGGMLGGGGAIGAPSINASALAMLGHAAAAPSMTQAASWAQRGGRQYGAAGEGSDSGGEEVEEMPDGSLRPRDPARLNYERAREGGQSRSVARAEQSRAEQSRVE